MRIRFALYVAIAAILVTAAGAVADARNDRQLKIKPSDEAARTLPASLL